MTNRRCFIQVVPLAGLLALSARSAIAAAIDEKDPQSIALGYVADAARLNRAQHPKFVPGQACSKCQLFQGKAGDMSGPCPLFAGKSVSSKGWCNAYVQKS